MMPPTQTPPCIIVARERPTLDWMSRRAKNCTIEETISIIATSGWGKTVSSLLATAPPSVLILALSPTMRTLPIRLAAACADAGGLVLVWRDANPEHPEQNWIMEQLMLQNEVHISHRLEHLLAIAALFPVRNLIPGRHVSVSPGGFLGRQLQPSFCSPSKPRSSTSTLTVTTNAPHLKCHIENTTILVNCDIIDLTDAIDFFRSRADVLALEDTPDISVDRDIVSMIVRPPKRLLSETTSKRLLDAFGFSFPNEKLCDSPNQAIQFAKDIAGPVVLKLVRPGLREKNECGAVITDIDSPADISRSYQSLIALGEQLAPPRPLGILVCEQIPKEHRFWIRMIQNKRYGTLLEAGIGDRPGPSLLLMKPPVTSRQLQRALPARLSSLETKSPPADIQANLAQVILRFSKFIDDLSPHLTCAEIHPVALRPGHPPVCLDALVEIGNHGNLA